MKMGICKFVAMTARAWLGPNAQNIPRHMHAIPAFCVFLWFVMGRQVLELMQMHPKERLRRVILAASWFIAINAGY